MPAINVIGASAGYIPAVYRAINSSAEVKSAVMYLTERHVVRLTRRHRTRLRARTSEYVLTTGAPNYLEREFVKAARRAGEPFPIGKVQLRHWPKKRTKA